MRWSESPVDAPGGWDLEVLAGSAAELHGAAVESRRTVRVHLVENPAIVLGSTQKDAVDSASASQDGVDVVRRRSGGGAVWLEPGAQVWLDVVLPAGDSLWVDDVRRSPLWLGGAWRGAVGTGSVWDGPVVGEWAREVCFGGIGPGEVYLDGNPVVKLVGISQRRTKDLARFQCIAYLDWRPELLAAYFVDPQVRAFRPAARAVDGDHWDMVSNFLANLPDS
jgi:lipoate-protein ligase A